MPLPCSRPAWHTHRDSSKPHPPRPTNRNPAPRAPSPQQLLSPARQSTLPGFALHERQWPKSPVPADGLFRFALQACAALEQKYPSDLGTFTPKYAIFARTFGFASFLSSRKMAALVHRATFLCVLGRLECLGGIEKDCDRAFIDQLHGHHRLENSGCHGDAEFAQRFAKFLVEGFGQFRRRRSNETRPPLPARIAIKRELRDDQGAAFHVQQRAVHLTLLVLENAQVRALLRERCGDCRSIFTADAQQNHQPRANFARHLLIHLYSGAADSLKNHPH